MTNAIAICLTAFRRPEILERSLDALEGTSRIRDLHIYIGLDGPNKQSDAKLQKENLRRLYKFQRGSRAGSVNIMSHSANIGRPANVDTTIAAGSTEHEFFIYLEEDTLSGKYFPDFVEDGLRRFGKDPRFLSVCGSLPIGEDQRHSEPVLMSGWWPLGFGMTSRRWRWLNAQRRGSPVTRLIRSPSALRCFSHQYKSLSVLPLISANVHVARDVEFAAIAQERGLISLFPPLPLCQNIGQNGSGEHAEVNHALSARPASDAPIEVRSANIRLRAGNSPIRGSLRQQTRRFIIRSIVLFVGYVPATNRVYSHIWQRRIERRRSAIEQQDQ